MVDVHVESSRQAFIATVSPATLTDNLGPLVHRLGATATATDQRVVLVIDVSDVVLNDAAAVKDFVGALVEWGQNRIRVVARRGTARALLRRWGGAGVSVHSSVDEALADRLGADPISA